MGLLKSIFFKKEEPIRSYEDFWNWFRKNEKTFFKVVKEREAARVLTIVRFRDMIKSHLLYRKKINGVWTDIYNTFPIPGQSSGKIHISGSRPENFATMELDYREPYSGNCPNYRSGELILAFLVTSEGPKLQWTRTEWTKSSLFFDEPCPDGTPRDASEFKIPAEMILTKVN